MKFAASIAMVLVAFVLFVGTTEAGFSGLTFAPVNAIEGNVILNTVVATFNSPDPLVNLSATIDWGDGTINTGTVSNVAPAVYEVTGTHSYSDDGIYTVKVTVTDTFGGVSTQAVSGPATIQEAVLSMIAMPGTATEGQSATITTATARDPGSPDPPSAFTATIDWGDGATSPGTITGFPGTYQISGTHTYAEEGTYTVTTTFFETFEPGFTVSGQAGVTVSDAPVTGSPKTVNFQAGAASTQVVASFTDADPNGTASDYTATINWGDSSSSLGTIAANGSGGFNVSGTHSYTNVGNFSVGVSINDTGGASTNVVSTAHVAASDLVVTKTGPATGATGVNLTYTVTVTNNGPADAGGVSLSDPLPGGTTFVSESQGSGPSFICANPPVGLNGTINCTIATLAAGATSVFSITDQISPSTLTGTLLTNIATISSAGTDPVPGNNSSTVMTTVSSTGIAPAITSPNTTTFAVGVNGTFTVTATGNPTPTLTMTGAVPAGVAFNSVTGVLSGPPGAGTAGSYPLVFTASNGVSPAATQNFTLIVSAGTAPAITSANNTTFTVGTAGTFTVAATGTSPITLSESGALPALVTFNPVTGMLSGTPAAGTQGVYTLTFTAANGVLPNATQTFTLTVNPAAPAGVAPVITSANATTFAIGTPGSFTVTATGTTPITFGQLGALPPGLSFNTTTGVLSGTPGPTAQGVFPLTFTASNGILPNASQAFTLTVNCNPLTKGCAGNPTVTVSPPSLGAQFIVLGKGLKSVQVGQTVPLQFSISNANASSLTGVGFTDTLPAGLQVAAGAPATCGGVAVVAPAGGSSISLTGASLGPSASCSFTITVMATSPGAKTNTTSAVTSNEGGPGNVGSDSITVVS